MLTSKQVETYQQIRSQLEALHEDFTGLSKKAADAPVNKLKIGIVNEKLRVANTILDEAHRPLEGFSEFDEAALPTASDVVIVLSQYINALEGWRSANVVQKTGFGWVWDTKERNYKASAPTRFLKE